MFKFDFEVEEEEDSDIQLSLPGPSRPSTAVAGQADTALLDDKKCYHVSLDDLLDALPESISYSPLYVPGLPTPILRRDLYDARFQLTQRDTDVTSGVGHGDSAGRSMDRQDDYVDSSTDLVPGLYEGGLKTWEGGVDLIEVMAGVRDPGAWITGSRVIEVGCGTAVPSAYLLSSLYTSQPADSTQTANRTPTTFHLQDFNRSVLELVTLPNLLLALLPHIPPELLRPEDDESEVEEVVLDTAKPGILIITENVKNAFKALLSERQVDLRFTYGHWGGLAADIGTEEKGYDLVLTSETIYEERSVDDLLGVLKASYKTVGQGQTVEVGVEDSLEDSLESMQLERWKSSALIQGETVVLIAAKILYFGVGGGVQDFLKRVEGAGGWHETVKGWTSGVGRRVFRIGW